MSDIRTCVSLYSLQDAYLNKRKDLGDIMRFVKSIGCEGIEILPDQMLKGAPDLSDETLAMWHSLLDETGLKAVCADVFLNTNLYKNRTLTHKECIDLLIKEIRMANKLGIHLIRLVSMVPYWVIEPLLPYCEQYDVTIALEIHGGMAFDIPETAAYIKEMKRVNSPYCGIVVDTGIFCRRFPRVVRAFEHEVDGLSNDFFDYIEGCFAKGSDLFATVKANGGEYPEDMKKALVTPQDHMMATIMCGYENRDYSEMDELMPFIKHFHFKCYEMTDEGQEYSINFPEIVKYLDAHDYHGYVATEYEGQRLVLSGGKVDEEKHVEAHQKLIQKCIADLKEAE